MKRLAGFVVLMAVMILALNELARLEPKMESAKKAVLGAPVLIEAPKEELSKEREAVRPPEIPSDTKVRPQRQTAEMKESKDEKEAAVAEARGKELDDTPNPEEPEKTSDPMLAQAAPAAPEETKAEPPVPPAPDSASEEKNIAVEERSPKEPAQSEPETSSIAAESAPRAADRPVTPMFVPSPPPEKEEPPTPKLASILKEIVASTPAKPEKERAADIGRIEALAGLQGRSGSTSPKGPRSSEVDEEAFSRMDRLKDAIASEETRISGEEQDGSYGWGVLNEYSDPDRAARLLGGVPFAKDRHGNFFRIDLDKGEVVPVANVLSGYGAIGLRATDPGVLSLFRRAVNSGMVKGPADSYTFWYLFNKRDASYLRVKTVRAFECYISTAGLSGDEAGEFRKRARLRGEVLLLKRPNGGELSSFIPSYFTLDGKRIAYPRACLARDDEWRMAGGGRLASAAGERR